MSEQYDSFFQSLKGKCLVASPYLDNTVWEKTVIYIVEHDTDGAVGFVLNRPSKTSVNAILTEITTRFEDGYSQVVHLGGPVKENNVYMLHSGDWYSASTQPATSDISWSYDEFMLEKMRCGDTPQEWCMFVGCSSWSSGQLEAEIALDSWLTIDANPAIVFASKKSDLWELGVEIAAQKMIDTYFY